MMFLMMHQPHLHQPWRLDRCNPFIHSFIDFALCSPVAFVCTSCMVHVLQKQPWAMKYRAQLFLYCSSESMMRVARSSSSCSDDGLLQQ